MVCMRPSWCAWKWLCGYLLCLTFSSFFEHLCMLALFDDRVAQVRCFELDLLIHYRDVLERAKDKLIKICDVFAANRPLNIGPQVIRPKGKWGFSRGPFQEHPKWDSYITLNGHRAGEATILYEHGADIEALMPKLLHSEYYTEPRIQELAAKERAEPWFCRRVKDFVYRCRDLRSQSRVC
ncbi:hypothetical protein MKW92_039208 [Papaver armeniacum]|nr:hypothetical protein MKW92_039208 [Papaver armeniacum]